jgi:putative hydrolase of the HAD superfamily
VAADPEAVEVRYRAVVFDLWQTLAVWPWDAGRELYSRMAANAGVDDARFFAAWDAGRNTRETGSMREYFEALRQELGANGLDIDELAAMRLSFTRDVLVPRTDAVATLDELKQRGYTLGLITNCSDEVQQLWDETAFAAHFDALVFSCDVGTAKPDPRIYAIAAERLRVPPEESVFVGDGANDELPGAERAGMRAIQLRVPGEELEPEAEAWQGERIASLSELPALLR